MLAAFADDEAFQKDLQRPMVRAALDLLWGSGGGGDSTDGSSSVGTTERLASVKADEGVVRISPLLKRFEGVCERARVRFPAGHLLARRRELSVDTSAELHILAKQYRGRDRNGGGRRQHGECEKG